jgi:uncharacterized protein (UPF0305 family)
MDNYRVTVWDKQANDPYYILDYDNEETAKYVARRMRVNYVDKWADIDEESIYEVRLQRFQGEQNA